MSYKEDKELSLIMDQQFIVQERQRESITSPTPSSNQRPPSLNRQSFLLPRTSTTETLLKQRPKSMSILEFETPATRKLSEAKLDFEVQSLETRQVETMKNTGQMKNVKKPTNVTNVKSDDIKVPKNIRSELKLFLSKLTFAIKGNDKTNEKSWNFVPISFGEDSHRDLLKAPVQKVSPVRRDTPPQDDIISPRLTTETMMESDDDHDSPHYEIPKRLDRRILGTLDKNYMGFFINPMAAFNAPDLRDSFELWLAKGNNMDFWKLLVAIHGLTKLQVGSKESIDAFWGIIDLYIHPGSKKDLSMVFKSTKGSILKKVELQERSKWELLESPCDLLDNLKKELITHLSNDMWPKFIKTDEGFKVMQNHLGNASVMSKNSAVNIQYKMQKVFFGYKFKGKDISAMNDLSDSHCFKYSYLLTNWKVEMESEGIEYNQDLSKNKLNVKLLVIPNPKATLIAEQGVMQFLSPTDPCPPHDSDKYHFGLMIGPIYFEWNDLELCIPKQAVPPCPLVCATLDYDFSLKQFDDHLSKVADMITSWNVKRAYTRVDKKDDFLGGSSWKFVESILECFYLGEIRLQPSIREIVNFIKDKETCDLEFKPSLDFQKVFKCKKSMLFKNHASLDEFIHKLMEVDSKFRLTFRDEYAFLKSVDSAIWMKNISLSREIQRMFEQLQECTKERLIKTLNGAPGKELEILSKEIKTLERNQKTLTSLREVLEPLQVKFEKDKQTFLKDDCPLHITKNFEYFL